MRHARLFRHAAIVGALGALVAFGAPPSQASAPSKEIIKCHKAIGTAVAKFFAGKQKAVGKCTDALFACQIKEENDGTDETKCFEKAKKKCAKSLAKIADPVKGLGAKARKKVDKKCAKVGLADLVDSPGGMGFQPVSDLCTLDGPITQMSDLLDCMQLLVETTVDTIGAFLKPRTCELLSDQGLATSPAFLVIPELWSKVVTEQLTAGGKDTWTLSVPANTAFFLWVDNADDGSGKSNIDLSLKMSTPTDSWEGDESDCTNPVIASCGSDDQCPGDAEIPEDDTVYTIDIEDSCGQASGGYKVTVAAIVLECGAPEPTLTLDTDDDP